MRIFPISVITLENTCDKDVEITVNMVHCCEETSKTQEKDCKSIYLLGGDMGILADKLVRNITLIYPNLVKSDLNVHAIVI